MTKFQLFEQERWLSKYEQQVEFNLSESGVYPLSLNELISYAPEFIKHLLETELNYPCVNGLPELRENIAALYQGANPDNILVTVGAIEANFITISTLLDPGDEIVVMLPNYMQIWGIAKNHQLKLKTFHLQEKNNWVPDLFELQEVVTRKTKLIAVCNPDNPTGYILSEKEMDAIINIADRVGAWILSDEVYRGAERLIDTQTASFYGYYDKVVAIGSLSKAYGLPGLRIGWAIAPVKTIDDIWARHEYVTISTTILSNKLAALALSQKTRPHIIQRTREYIRKGFPILNQWIDRNKDIFSLRPPQAAAIAFIRYHVDIKSTELTENLRKDKSVLLVPGSHFGMDGYLRVNFGLPAAYLQSALHRIDEFMTGIKV